MHWPEGFWRSDYTFICYIKALFWFIPIVYIAKLMGYKWVFSSHNVIPHYKVRSLFLERLMRLFILKKFDLVIGLAYNTKSDLELAFGTSGKRYVLALHGIYNRDIESNNQIALRKELQIPKSAKIILSINSLGRQNKGIDGLLKGWEKLENKGDIHLLITGEKPTGYNKLKNDKNFHFIEGYIPDDYLKRIFNCVDFMLFNYKNITTSGMYFMTITYGLASIAPNLPFFKLHSSDKTTLFFDYNVSLSSQMKKIFKKINNGWEPDLDEFDKLRVKYNTKSSAEEISKAFYSLL